MRRLVLLYLILWSQIAASQATASKYYSQSQPDTSTYIQEYQDVLDYATNNGIKHPSNRVKSIQNNLMIDLVNSGVYQYLRNFTLPSNPTAGGALYVMNGDHL